MTGGQAYDAVAYNSCVYSPALLDHFEHPRNAGTLENPDASIQLENPVCGDILKLTAVLHGEVISEIRFQAKGCVSAMACASALTELVRGKTLTQAAALKPKDIVREVVELPPASSHAAQLAADALKALIAKLSHC